LRELRSASSAKEAEVVKCRIRQLEYDLHQHAIDYNSHQFDTDKCVLFGRVQYLHNSCFSVTLVDFFSKVSCLNIVISDYSLDVSKVAACKILLLRLFRRTD